MISGKLGYNYDEIEKHNRCSPDEIYRKQSTRSKRTFSFFFQVLSKRTRTRLEVDIRYFTTPLLVKYLSTIKKRCMSTSALISSLAWNPGGNPALKSVKKILRIDLGLVFFPRKKFSKKLPVLLVKLQAQSMKLCNLSIWVILRQY